ncbi:hypothetical protein JOE21_000354 [Desmospora profundinema]|uniref:DUF1540 domain-containing protein n=1 Tax=Desmospora profundinema TaxID=1571184 RepID=A0ABU1IHW7_9BACL|nr:hypothetical protein [Desmospora profundinema]
MARDVLCEVDRCTYWGDGNQCRADKIYVVSHTEEPNKWTGPKGTTFGL